MSWYTQGLGPDRAGHGRGQVGAAPDSEGQLGVAQQPSTPMYYEVALTEQSNLALGLGSTFCHWSFCVEYATLMP